jgi:DNA polymerase elongation subunit (family B)
LFYDILEKLKTINNKEEFEEAKLEVSYLIQVVVTNFDTIPLDDFVFKIKVAQEPSEYKVKPQVVRAGEQLGKVEKGQFVKFIKTWHDIKVKPIQLAKRSDIDRVKYIESLESVMNQITEPMGISMDLLLGKGQQTSLTDW